MAYIVLIMHRKHVISFVKQFTSDIGKNLLVSLHKSGAENPMGMISTNVRRSQDATAENLDKSSHSSLISRGFIVVTRQRFGKHRCRFQERGEVTVHASDY